MVSVLHAGQRLRDVFDILSPSNHWLPSTFWKFSCSRIQFRKKIHLSRTKLIHCATFCSDTLEYIFQSACFSVRCKLTLPIKIRVIRCRSAEWEDYCSVGWAWNLLKNWGCDLGNGTRQSPVKVHLVACSGAFDCIAWSSLAWTSAIKSWWTSQ